jgi:hypothetical protein
MKRVVLFTAVLIAAMYSGPTAYGQLTFNGILNGSAAGTITTGTGTAFGTFSPDLKSLTYQVTVAGLSGPITGAHFHIGPSGTVVHPITFVGNTATGSWTNIPDSILTYFFTRNLYINVHTSLNPNGEIRGTIHPTQFLFTVNLNGQQNGTSSTARGTGFVRWDDSTGNGAVNEISYILTIAGLNGTFSASHFHVLPSGSIVHPITFFDSTAVGTWSGVPDSILTLMLHGKVYINVHSSFAPSGEISGILTPVGQMEFVASMDGTQSGTPSTGRGTAFAILSSDATSLKYSATYGKLVSTFAAAHFHTAVDGSIIHPVTFSNNTTTGTWTGLSDTNLQDLLRGRVYLNVHSALYPSGEIRGAFKLYDGTFTAQLTGQEAGTSSTGTGTAWLHLGGSSDSAFFQATWTGLAGPYTGSHFHIAPSGSIIHPIPTTDSTTGSGAWLVPDSLLKSIVQKQVYVNVHSTIFPQGDIRGTIAAELGTVVSVRQLPEAVPASFALDQNYPNPFNPTTTIKFSLSQPEFVTLTIYNILGQRIATLLNEKRNAGTYEVTFDAGKFASGMYIYNLRTSGGLSQTRKMVLMK